MSDASDIYVILDDLKPKKKPSASSSMKEISFDDDGIYEYIGDDRDDRRSSRHSRDLTRDAARVVNTLPVASQPPRRRVLVAEGIVSFCSFN